MGKGFAGYKGNSPRFKELNSQGVYSIDKVHDLSMSAEWPYEFTAITFDIEYLVVGGGGGPGDAAEGNGGGGGGGVLTNYGGTQLNINGSQNYNVVVGAGGASATNGSNSRFYGSNSQGSAFDLTAIGGGAGIGSSGGSGGGGTGQQTQANGHAAAVSGGSGTSGQGFAGGDGGPGQKANDFLCGFRGQGCEIVTTGGGGGGGGAGGAGTSGSGAGGSPIVAGDGGDGVANSITGTSVTYAGGAGGDAEGGTNGSDGAGASNYGGGNAQDGVVILRIPDSVTGTNPDGSLTFTQSTDGLFKVYTITAGSGAFVFT